MSLPLPVCGGGKVEEEGREMGERDILEGRKKLGNERWNEGDKEGGKEGKC